MGGGRLRASVSAGTEAAAVVSGRWSWATGPADAMRRGIPLLPAGGVPCRVGCPRSRASIVASNEILLGKLTAAFANKDGEYVEVGEVR
jgi:hypothetical protein